MSYKERAKSNGGQVEDLDTPPPLPCSVCGSLTPVAVLMMYGARCTPCYRTYCRCGPSAERINQPPARPNLRVVPT